jgi:hypothetical protein
MRFTATVLATILAVLAVSETRPAVSGMTSTPPCEVTPQVPTTTKPQAPKNLRIVPGLEELWDFFMSGPNAGPDPDYFESEAAVADPHAYYFGLASRSDCLYAASFRNAAQVAALRSNCDHGCFFKYDYAGDTDPRRQDAMKFTLPQGFASSDEQMRVGIGSSGINGQSALFTMDYWTGAEWKVADTKITNHKGSPMYLFRGSTSARIGFWTGYQEAGQSPQTQPPGGPFNEMLWVHATGSTPNRNLGTWRDGDTGFPRMRLPLTASSTSQRSYTEGLMEVDKTDQTAAGGTAANVGQEIGIVPERWHRFWIYVERTPANDYVCDLSSCVGQQMQAYKMTVWFADTVRGPIRVVDGRDIGFPDDGIFINQVRIENSCGAQCTTTGSLEVNRGPLVKYYRNFVTLRGITKTEVLKLLQKPVV